MEALHLPDNIKVHFAGCEVQNQYICAQRLGVRYGLYTCFPFVERMVFDKALAPIFPLRGMENQGNMTVAHLSGIFKTDEMARREFYKLIDLQ